MRRFEFSEGTSNKFWEIELDGDSFTVRYGRLGTDGQTQTKTFDSPAKAQFEHDKLVAEKVKKGYVEGGGGAAAAAAPKPAAAAAPKPAPSNGAMAALWQRAEAVLKSKYPARHKALRKGASNSQLAALEQLIGAELPEDFKSSLRLHNGQEENGEGVLRDWELLSTDRIADEWKIWKELYDGGDFADAEGSPGPGVKPHWWHPLWLPLTSNGGGDHQCLDLDPASEGKRGQVIQMWHDDAPREVQGASFEAWFEGFVNDLEAGKAYEEAEAEDDGAAGDARRFEFSDGTSNKFWEISLAGDSFTVRYGRLGTDGQTQTKTFDSPDKAQKEHDKLVAEKLKKGYDEV